MDIEFESLRQGHADLLADPVAHTELVKLANERAVESGLVQLPQVMDAVQPSKLTLSQWQTGFGDQADRGTCYAFAACAAMEAAYRRQYGVTLDLSEQYVFHINKVTALLSDWSTNPAKIENNSTLTGFQGSSDMVDKLARFAASAETEAKYLTNAQMTAIRDSTPAVGDMTSQPQCDAFEFNDAVLPLVAHQRGRYQIDSFGALPANPSVDQVKQVLRAGYEVVADIPDHCFLIIGYDDGLRGFEVKNSWGENTYIKYSYDKPILGGRYITKVLPVDSVTAEAAWMGGWSMDHDGWLGEIMFRRFTDFGRGDAERTKLGDYYRAGHRYDVNGSVYPDGDTIEFWIADTENRTQPGSDIGQRFVLQFCENDRNNAAGVTEYGSVEYGVRLTRHPLAHKPISQFDVRRWVDGWSISTGTHSEVLRISNVNPLEGRYERGGLTYDIEGNVDPETPHNIRFKVPFDQVAKTTYELFHHTREDGAVSGYARPPGRAFGIQADRYVEPYYPPFAPPGPGVMTSFIYAIPPSGILQWFRHDGARHGGFDWKGARQVGQGWDGLRAVLPGGGNVIYAVGTEGELLWYEHVGFNTGAGLRDAGSWVGPTLVNHGFGQYVHVFSGGNGVIYGITSDGRLIWYRHHSVASGGPVESAGSWSGPKEVGVGWGSLLKVFGGGDGIIYAVNATGGLLWYNHLGHREGLGLGDPGAWSDLNGATVGVGWSGFTSLFSSGDGVVYGVQPDGVLRWYRHLAYKTGGGLDVAGSWEGGVDVGWGWINFDTVFALLPRDPDPVH